MVIRRIAYLGIVALLVVVAVGVGYVKGHQDAAATPAASPFAPSSSPSASPSLASPLTPVALGTADVGTVLFAETNIVWKFDGSGRLQALFATPSHSRGHAMTFDVGGQAGFLDARNPSSPITPLSQRADPATSDLSPDGKKIAYLVDQHVRVYEQVFFNGKWTDYVPEWRFSSLRWSPSGRYLAATGLPATADPAWPKDVHPGRGEVPSTVYIVDLEANAVRPLWVPPGEARPPLPPARPPIQFVSWSPDEHYVLLRHPSVASGEDANGRELFALEVATGAVTPLGLVVPTFSWISWKAPHTLAYVEGDRYEPWQNKRVRIWSPEDGFRDVTGPSQIATSPSWDAAGRLFFVRGTAGASNAAADTLHLVVFDPQSGQTTELLRDSAYTEHAVRLSDDGAALLVIRRRIEEPLLEMWTLALDHTSAHVLWRFTPFWTVNDPYTRTHAIYQSAAIFDFIAWSR